MLDKLTQNVFFLANCMSACCLLFQAAWCYFNLLLLSQGKGIVCSWAKRFVVCKASVAIVYGVGDSAAASHETSP